MPKTTLGQIGLKRFVTCSAFGHTCAGQPCGRGPPPSPRPPSAGPPLFFSPLPLQISFFFPSGVFPRNCVRASLGHFVKHRGLSLPQRFARQPKNSKCARLRVPALLTPPKIHEKTPEREKERNWPGAGTMIRAVLNFHEKHLQDMNACVPTFDARAIEGGSRSSASASWRSTCGAFVGGRWTQTPQRCRWCCPSQKDCSRVYPPGCRESGSHQVFPPPNSILSQLWHRRPLPSSGWTADTTTASTEHSSWKITLQTNLGQWRDRDRP